MQIFYNVLMEIVTSYWVAATLAPSHVIGEVIASGSVCTCTTYTIYCVCVFCVCVWTLQVEWPKPGKNNTFDRDW